MTYGHLAVFIRHGPVEIRRLRCQRKHNMASAGVFVLVVRDLRRSIRSFAGKPRMILV